MDTASKKRRQAKRRSLIAQIALTFILLAIFLPIAADIITRWTPTTDAQRQWQAMTELERIQYLTHVTANFAPDIPSQYHPRIADSGLTMMDSTLEQTQSLREAAELAIAFQVGMMRGARDQVLDNIATGSLP